ATIIDVGRPLAGDAAARAWLNDAGEDDLLAGLSVLNRTLQAFRLVTADPYLAPAGPQHALVGRGGFGAGGERAVTGRSAPRPPGGAEPAGAPSAPGRAPGRTGGAARLRGADAARPP